jgi:hypothetical protein
MDSFEVKVIALESGIPLTFHETMLTEKLGGDGDRPFSVPTDGCMFE